MTAYLARRQYNIHELNEGIRQLIAQGKQNCRGSPITSAPSPGGEIVLRTQVRAHEWRFRPLADPVGGVGGGGLGRFARADGMESDAVRCRHDLERRRAAWPQRKPGGQSRDGHRRRPREEEPRGEQAGVGVVAGVDVRAGLVRHGGRPALTAA